MWYLSPAAGRPCGTCSVKHRLMRDALLQMEMIADFGQITTVNQMSGSTFEDARRDMECWAGTLRAIAELNDGALLAEGLVGNPCQVARFLTSLCSVRNDSGGSALWRTGPRLRGGFGLGARGIPDLGRAGFGLGARGIRVGARAGFGLGRARDSGWGACGIRVRARAGGAPAGLVSACRVVRLCRRPSGGCRRGSRRADGRTRS